MEQNYSTIQTITYKSHKSRMFKINQNNLMSNDEWWNLFVRALSSAFKTNHDVKMQISIDLYNSFIYIPPYILTNAMQVCKEIKIHFLKRRWNLIQHLHLNLSYISSSHAMWLIRVIKFDSFFMQNIVITKLAKKNIWISFLVIFVTSN